MACITIFAQPMTMATTELAREIQCISQRENASTWQTATHVERTPLRMSWVVVTDGDGNQHLRMQWKSAVAC